MNRTLVCLGVLAVLGVGASAVRAGVISDFEDGTLDGWGDLMYTSVAVVPGGSQGSNYALMVTRTDDSEIGYWAQKALSPTEWADIASHTTLSYDVMVPYQEGIGTWTYWPGTGPSLHSQTGGSDNPGYSLLWFNGQWETRTWTYPAQPTDPGAWANMCFASVFDTGVVAIPIYLDNIRVSGDIPEPASLSLIALGGLALLGRRPRRA